MSEHTKTRSYRSVQASGQAELDTLERERRTRIAGWDAQWHAAGAWCAQQLPDLIDPHTGAACGFAVASALRLRSETGKTPVPSDVRRARNQWMKRLSGEGDA